MFKRAIPAILALSFGAFALLSGCKGGGNASNVKSKRAGVNEVIVQMSADPQRLNPVTSNESYASEIQNQVFQGLLDIDGNDFSLVPILAVARPKITPVEEGEYKGGLTMEFEIRPEAKWDNGTPVLASDVEFSLKSIKNPFVDCESQRGYMQFIDDFKTDPANPRKFTLYCHGHYLQSEIAAGSTTILPEYVYDPGKLMREFSLKDLNDAAKIEKLKSNPKIIQFAKDFNGEKFQREPAGVVGSGPYAFESWVTTQRITLKKKANWWGDALAKGGNKYFNAGPDKLIYQIIPDATTAYTALKDEGLDVMYFAKPKDFVDLQKNEEIKKLYNPATPQRMMYSYIALNEKKPQLADKKVRQALSYAADKQFMISTYMYGLAIPTVGPFNPAKKYYDNDLKPYAYDLEKAKALLDEAGWKDSDGDGIRDKMINGQKVDLKFAFKYPSSSPVAEQIALLFKESCAKIGVGVDVVAREWTVFIQESKAHDFDAFTGNWVADPVPDDPYQIWHSASYATGDNYEGFGTPESDQLIDKIRYELDETKRDAMYKRLQEIIYDECPYIFLFCPKNRIAIHRRFDNANPIVKRPGYEVNQFKLNPNFGVKAAAN